MIGSQRVHVPDDWERWSLAALLAMQGIGHRSAKRIAEAVQHTRTSWSQFWARGGDIEELDQELKPFVPAIQKFLTEQSFSDYKQSLINRNIRVIIPTDPEWPPLLRLVDGAPVVLFARGSPMSWQEVPIAVVGTRRITPYGKLVTDTIVSQLVENGCQIISGCMYGVDTRAHFQALHAGGKTIGVLGYGLDHVYPKNHQPVLEQLLEKGATLISPFSPETMARQGNFPARNQVVAGMCAATVVTEAAHQSGTHITASYAVEYDRLVCAVPGSFMSPFSEGTKWLINEGATLITSGAEVVEILTDSYRTLLESSLPQYSFSTESPTDSVQLGGITQPTSTTQTTDATSPADTAQSILSLITTCPLTTEQLREHLALPYESLLTQLLALEIQGKITRQGETWTAMSSQRRFLTKNSPKLKSNSRLQGTS